MKRCQVQPCRLPAKHKGPHTHEQPARDIWQLKNRINNQKRINARLKSKVRLLSKKLKDAGIEDPYSKPFRGDTSRGKNEPQ